VPQVGARGDVATLSDARAAVERAVGSYANPDLKVTEVMEFANNYYAEVREKDTGIGAMELLVDKGELDRLFAALHGLTLEGGELEALLRGDLVAAAGMAGAGRGTRVSVRLLEGWLRALWVR